MCRVVATLFLSLFALGLFANTNGRNAPSQIPTRIMGSGKLTPEDLRAFFANTATGSDFERAHRLAFIYIDEARAEGVNHDIAFAQMVLETGFLRFQGVVVPEMNNFAGLGAISATQNGIWFPCERTGIRAHIQHLKAYGCRSPLAGELVNPRFHLVSPRGKAPTIDGLAGTWATDPQYAVKIKSILRRMYAQAEL